MKIQIATQLALFLDNIPGTLARVCDALKKARINIYALTVSDTVDHAVVRMVVSEPRKALLLFEEHGTLVIDTEVLLVEAVNKPGALAAVAHRLGDANVNIEYAYCATSANAKRGVLVLRVDDAKKALKVLKG
jgi:hypothetical protein